MCNKHLVLETYLIFINFCFLQFGFSLLLKSDDDQGHENVDEEERENNKVNDIEDGHLNSIDWNRPLVFIGNGH